jgi:hypothetical protein
MIVGRARSIALLIRGLALAGILGVGMVSTGVGQSPPADTYGRWMTEAPAAWPRITMINQIEYTDAKHPVAACGFLVDIGDEVVAATAKHVLIYFKSEAMDSVSFEGTLERWRMFPKDRPEEIVVIDQLINRDRVEPLRRIPPSRDWLLFTIRERTDAVQPLKLRTSPLDPGEKVFVVGWRSTGEGRQDVYEGRFVRRDRGSVLISVEALTDNTMPGLSGSPVIDARGYVVGLMSAKSGRLQRLAPVEYPLAILRERSAPEQP